MGRCMTRLSACIAGIVIVFVAGQLAAREPYGPRDFLAMMEKSDITYQVREDANLKPTRLNIMWHGKQAISTYARAEIDTRGSARIVIDEPRADVATIYKEAPSLLSQKKYDELIALYQRAIKADPDYFASWTFLGDTYYMREDYPKALEAFRKAIALNPVGYQAYYFMADAYDKMGKKKEALEAITHAYMLNKNNPRIAQSLERILKSNGMRIRVDRLEFPFAIQEKSTKKCEISFRTMKELGWMPLVNCLACWKMEPALRKENGKGVSSAMYDECIVNQVAGIEQRKRDGKKLLEKEGWLERAVREDYLHALVTWEIGAGIQPDIMLTLSKADRDIVLKYIQTFVFE